MPKEDTAELTPEEAQRAIDRLTAYDKRRGHDLTCPVCNTQTWNLGPQLLELRTASLEGPLAPFAYFPMVAISCAECGNTLMFHASIFEISRDPAEATEEGGDADAPPKK